MPHKLRIQIRFTVITGKSATYITGSISWQPSARYVLLQPSMLCPWRAI